jgi:putative transposase
VRRSHRNPPTDEGKLQLAAVLDLHSRRCVGFAMGIHHDAELARAALCVAIAIRGGAVAGVLFHTDQGSAPLPVSRPRPP